MMPFSRERELRPTLNCWPWLVSSRKVAARWLPGWVPVLRMTVCPRVCR